MGYLNKDSKKWLYNNGTDEGAFLDANDDFKLTGATKSSCIYLRTENPITVNMPLADTWYDVVSSDFTYYLPPCHFTHNNATSVSTFTKAGTHNILFIGDAIVKLNSTDIITVGLFINGVLVPYMESEYDVSFLNKSFTLGINGIGDLTENDEVKIRVKCNVLGKQAIFTSLHTTIIERI